MLKTRQQKLETALDMVQKGQGLIATAAWLNQNGVTNFGVIVIKSDYYELAYINMGDTYDTTIVRDNASGEYQLAGWGDVVEQKESEHCKAEGLIRCAYCGELTAVASDWRETVCEFCSHLVGGQK